MVMELKQHLKMVQQLRMTPQLQQAIKLLQLSKLELVDLVQKELVENPVLEEMAEEAKPETTRRLAEPSASEKVKANEQAEKVQADQVVDEIDWDAYLENYSAPLPSNSYRSMHDDLPGPEATLTKTEDLVEHLLWQLNLNAVNDDDRRIGDEIIGNLDGKGYLVGVTVEGIAERCEVDAEIVEGVLEFVQEFDPIGVAARNLRECLLVQARHFYPEEKNLIDILDRHLPDLEKRNIKPILRGLGISKDDLIAATKLLSTLDPAPGGAYSVDESVYITPDVYVYRVGDDYICVLNEDGLPKLRVSEYYRQALNKSEKSAKDYIQDKLRSAWWLIRSIHQRQRTIIRVTESIFRFQRGFLDEGVSALKPLVLRDVADDIGVHESTVSRVTTNKYVHTPRGIFELKYFFNSAIGCSDGTDTASESVKMRIKQIVGEEDTAKPLSDQKIARILAAEGIEIARRTVAKYREMLGILKSSQRKKLF